MKRRRERAMVNLTQKLLRALFRTLDFVEDVRGAVRRFRGASTSPPPWQTPVHAPAPPPSRAGNDDEEEPVHTARSRAPTSTRAARTAGRSKARKPKPQP